MEKARERYPVAVVGGGQAGLAVSYYLKRAGVRHVVLDASRRIGDSWRLRWEGLRLFTPARIDGLPGLRFPARAAELPGKDEMADYLEGYAERFQLPVRSGVRVAAMEVSSGGFLLATTAGEMEADQVVVATGANQTPRVPDFARELAPRIKQVSAADYRGPSQLDPGDVLVVGAGNSGAEIALGCAPGHRTWLAGRDTGAGSMRNFSRPLWWVGLRLLTRSTPPGRRMIAAAGRGAPLVRIRPADLGAAGVERVGRVSGTQGGLPRLEDGRVLDVANVVWCTGFRRNFRWIHAPVFDDQGEPLHRRGVVEFQPGLYFVGLPLLHSLASALAGGVGRDARFIAKRVLERRRRLGDVSTSGQPEPAVHPTPQARGT